MKKVLSIILSLIMIIGVIPFYAVESSAESPLSTHYTVKVRVYTDVDADGWNSAYVKVFGADGYNGYGEEALLHQVDVKSSIDDSKEEYVGSFDCGTSFPTKIQLYTDFGGGFTWRSWTGDLEVYINGKYVAYKKCTASSSAFSSSNTTHTVTIDKKDYPYAYNYELTGFTTEAYSESYDENPESTVCVYALDQYGVYWYGENGMGPILSNTDMPSTETCSFIGSGYDRYGAEGTGDSYCYFGWNVTTNAGIDHSSTYLYTSKSLNTDHSETYHTVDVDYHYLHKMDLVVNDTVEQTIYGYDRDSDLINEVAAPEGYTLSGYTKLSGSGSLEYYGSSCRFVFATTDAVVSPVFVPNSYTIAYDGNASDAVSLDSTTTAATYDRTVQLKENPFEREGYHFIGWNTKADGTGDSYQDLSYVKNLSSVDGATVTLYAQWAVNTYRVFLVYPDSTGMDEKEIYVSHGSNITVDQTLTGSDESGHWRFVSANKPLTNITADQTIALTYEKVSHNYGPKTVVTPYTCTTDGESTETCEDCGYVKHNILPHAHTNVVTNPRYEATCEQDGKTEETVCLDCNEIISAGTVLPANHHDLGEPEWNWEFTGTTFADCEAAATLTVRCNTCGKVFTEVATEAPELIAHSANAFACSGGDMHYTATLNVDNTAFTDSNTRHIDGNGNHNTELVASGNPVPTADSNGIKDYYRCTNCYGYFIDADGHIPLIDYADVQIPYIEYIAYGDGAVAVKYNGTDTAVTVPDTVPSIYPYSEMAGKPVVGIFDEAFKNQTALTKITMGDNIEFIDESAFAGCTALEEVIIGSGLTAIGQNAFAGCSSLTDITIKSTENIQFIQDSNTNAEPFDGVTAATIYGYHAAASLLNYAAGQSNLTFASIDNSHTFRVDSAATIWAADNSSATLKIDCYCGDTHTLNASVTGEVAAAETCVADGVMLYTASAQYDGITYTDTKTQAIPANGIHTITYHPAKNPTGLDNGNTEYWMCDRCGKCFSDGNAQNEITQQDTLIPQLYPNMEVGEFYEVGQTLRLPAYARIKPFNYSTTKSWATPMPVVTVFRNTSQPNVRGQIGGKNYTLAMINNKSHFTGVFTFKTVTVGSYRALQGVALYYDDNNPPEWIWNSPDDIKLSITHFVDDNGNEYSYSQVAQASISSVTNDYENNTRTVTANVTLRGASFSATHTFPVTFNVLNLDANGGTGSMDSVKFLGGDSYTLPANGFIAPSGYGFKCWEVDGEDKQVGDKITLTSSTVIKAKWSTLRTVSFNSGAGTGTMANVQVVDGTYYKLPDSTFTAPDRKEFGSWQTGVSELAAGESILVESDMTFTAAYVAKRYAVTVSGVNVTADNCSDILGDGSVTYDPDTNTMVLTNATIEVSKYGDSSAAFGIRHNETFDNTPFVIVLNGVNNIVDNVADDGVNEKWGVGIYGATGYYRFEGNGTLNISMNADDSSITYYGIQARAYGYLYNGIININIPGTAKTLGYYIVYSNTLNMCDGAQMHILVGDHANSVCLSNNKTNVNLEIGDDCLLECTSGARVADSYFKLNSHSTAHGAFVNTEPSYAGSFEWNKTTALTNYKYYKTFYFTDIDEDGALDFNDVEYIIRYVNGDVTMSDGQLSKADVDGDGAVDAYDAAYLERTLDAGAADFGDVNEDGNIDLTDYALVRAYISGVDSDPSHPADLNDSAYLDLINDYGTDGYYTQYFVRADIDRDKAVDAFDLFYIDKAINGLV